MKWLWLLAVAGCVVGDRENPPPDDPDTGCLDNLVTLTLNVVDASGASVDGLAHTTTFDGNEVTLVSGYPQYSGKYGVFDDSMQRQLNLDPQPITVHFSLGADTLDVTAYVSDDSDYCHVQWSPMPDTVVWPH